LRDEAKIAGQQRQTSPIRDIIVDLQAALAHFAEIANDLKR